MNERMNEAIKRKHTMFIIYKLKYIMIPIYELYLKLSTYRLTYKKINTRV